MRLLTRSDFDGLACAVLLKEANIIDSWKFVHPKDVQDGLIEVGGNDCLANVPFAEGCGLWFDHHASEDERNLHQGKYSGVSANSPSAAHLIYDYYGGAEKFPHLLPMLEAVDKVDSANLTQDEILDPRGWVLLGFIMDPRTGLGRFRDFNISNYQLMEELILWCAHKTIEEIMVLPDVKERIVKYFEQTALFKIMIAEHTTLLGNVIVTDVRGLDLIYTGNRFIIYSLYPEQNISAWIVSGKGGVGCSVAVGHSVLNRTSLVDVGALMLKYGGGGHRAVGTCQFLSENMETQVTALLEDLQSLSN